MFINISFQINKLPEKYILGKLHTYIRIMLFMKESKLSLKTKQKNIGLPSSELPESSKNIV